MLTFCGVGLGADPLLPAVTFVALLLVPLLIPLWFEAAVLPALVLLLLLPERLLVHAVEGCEGGLLLTSENGAGAGDDWRTRIINSCFSLQSWNEMFFFWRKSHKSLVLIFWRYSLWMWGAFNVRQIKQFVTVVSREAIPSLKHSLQKSLLQLEQFLWNK